MTPKLGLDLVYGPETCQVRIEITGDQTLVYRGRDQWQVGLAGDRPPDTPTPGRRDRQDWQRQGVYARQRAPWLSLPIKLAAGLTTRRLPIRVARRGKFALAGASP